MEHFAASPVGLRVFYYFFFSSKRRNTRSLRDWSSDVCSSDLDEAPAAPLEIELGFEEGIPVTLDGAKVDSVDLVRRLNELAGKHGVGRIDMVEDRLVGIKSREIYEAPAAVLLHQAHRALEALVLTKEALRFKAQGGR